MKGEEDSVLNVLVTYETYGDSRFYPELHYNDVKSTSALLITQL